MSSVRDRDVDSRTYDKGTDSRILRNENLVHFNIHPREMHLPSYGTSDSDSFDRDKKGKKSTDTHVSISNGRPLHLRRGMYARLVPRIGEDVST